MVSTRRTTKSAKETTTPPISSVTASVGISKKKKPTKAIGFAGSVSGSVSGSDKGDGSGSNKLTPLETARFHVHIESLKNCDFKDLLERRPSTYRSKYLQYQQRFHYLRRVKDSTHPSKSVDHWWKLLSKARELIYASGEGEGEDEATAETTAAKEKDPDYQEDPDKEEEEDSKPAAKKHKPTPAETSKPTKPPPRPPTTSKAPPRPASKPSVTIPTNQPANMSDDEAFIGASTISTRQNLFGSPEGKGGRGKHATRFTNEEEIKEFW